MNKQKRYTADFETTTDINDCRVWAWGICDIDTLEFKYGNTIESFIEFLKNNGNSLYYFHNLKFDSQFIIYHLFESGYKYFIEDTDICDNSFTTLENELGGFYSMDIVFNVNKNQKYRNKKVKIVDSMKLLNMSVENVVESFGLPIEKLEIDYKKYRKKGHVLDSEEIAYLRNDVEIMARALKIMFEDGHTKMTIGGNAIENYKTTITNWKYYYPELDDDIDSYIRKSYKGGFTYLNPIKKNLIINDGIVIDKNSMYPSMMRYKLLPYGQPVYFQGKYEYDEDYPLYIQRITCAFRLKKGKIPTIQVKNSFKFLPNEYIEDSDYEILTLTLTNIDLELFLENYDITIDIEYHDGFKFKGMVGLFDEYIDYWTLRKIESKKLGNKGIYLMSKLFLNSLYGKFGTNPYGRKKTLEFIDGEVKNKITPLEKIKSYYLPMASFITSYARDDIIRSSQKLRDYTLEKYGEDYYIYSDTDSIHAESLTDEELKEIFDIDSYKLGAWDLEKRFTKAKFIRQKCYIEEVDEKLETTIAGLPKSMGKYVNFDNFKEGFQILASDITKNEKKLRYVKCKGGVVLVETDFTIK